MLSVACMRQRADAVALEPFRAASSPATIAAPPTTDAATAKQTTGAPSWPATSRDDLVRIDRELSPQPFSVDEGGGIGVIPSTVKSKLEAVAREYATTFAFMNAGGGEENTTTAIDLHSKSRFADRRRTLRRKRMLHSIMCLCRDMGRKNPIHTFETDVTLDC